MNRFERISEKKLPDKECFYGYLKDRTTGDNGEKLDSNIREKNI